MSLREHGLGEHFELSDGLNDAYHVKLSHELSLGLLEQVVLLQLSRAPPA